jgi:hypothetical protein
MLAVAIPYGVFVSPDRDRAKSAYFLDGPLVRAEAVDFVDVSRAVSVTGI